MRFPAARMKTLADATEQNAASRVERADSLVEPEVLADPRYGEYARNSIARYEQLENFTAILSASP